jgi:hypothetical protein
MLKPRFSKLLHRFPLKAVEKLQGIFSNNLLNYGFPYWIPCLSERLPLWPSGQISCLQIQRSGLGSRHYQIFWEVVGLEWGPLNLVRTIGELLERKNSGSGLENCEYDRKGPSRWPRDIICSQKFALTSLTSGCRSPVIFRSRTETTDFVCCFVVFVKQWFWNKLCAYLFGNWLEVAEGRKGKATFATYPLIVDSLYNIWLADCDKWIEMLRKEIRTSSPAFIWRYRRKQWKP